MAGAEQDCFVGGDTFPHKLGESLEIIFGETGVAKPVVKAEG
jgi:hypothetical protein